MGPPARRGHRGLRPGGKWECGMQKRMAKDIECGPPCPPARRSCASESAAYLV